MKKLLILICLHVTVSSFGQFSLGIKGGLNVNNIAVKEEPDVVQDMYKPNIGFYVGIYGRFVLREKLSFIPEIQFSQRGWNNNSYSPGARQNVNYIEVPLLLSYAPIQKLSVDVGPNVGFNVSSQTKAYSYDFNRLDFGLTGGIRLSLSEKISVTARYYWGLTSLGTLYLYGPADEPLGAPKAYTRNGQLGLTYKLK